MAVVIGRTWTYAARRRVWLYAPLAMLAGIGLAVADYRLNALGLLAGFVLVAAGLASALDDSPATPTNTNRGA